MALLSKVVVQSYDSWWYGFKGYVDVLTWAGILGLGLVPCLVEFC